MNRRFPENPPSTPSRALCCLISAGVTVSAFQAPGHAAEPALIVGERFGLPLGKLGINDLESARIADHLDWNLATWIGFSNDPLIQQPSGRALIDGRLSATVLGSVSLFELVEVGAAVPMILAQAAGADQPELSSMALGSVRVGMKLGLLAGGERGLSLAVLSTIHSPAGTSQAHAGESRFAFGHDALVEHGLGPGRFVLGIGHLLRASDPGPFLLGHELHAGLGYAFPSPWDQKAELAIDLTSATSLVNAAEDPIGAELGAGLTQPVNDRLSVLTGATVGWGDRAGIPTWRAYVALRILSEQGAEARLRVSSEEEAPAEPFLTVGGFAQTSAQVVASDPGSSSLRIDELEVDISRSLFSWLRASAELQIRHMDVFGATAGFPALGKIFERLAVEAQVRDSGLSFEFGRIALLGDSDILDAPTRRSYSRTYTEDLWAPSFGNGGAIRWTSGDFGIFVSGSKSAARIDRDDLPAAFATRLQWVGKPIRVWADYLGSSMAGQGARHGGRLGLHAEAGAVTGAVEASVVRAPSLSVARWLSVKGELGWQPMDGLWTNLRYERVRDANGEHFAGSSAQLPGVAFVRGPDLELGVATLSVTYRVSNAAKLTFEGRSDFELADNKPFNGRSSRQGVFVSLDHEL